MDIYLFNFRIDQEAPRMTGHATIVESAEDFDSALQNALDRLTTTLDADEGSGFTVYEDGFFKLSKGAAAIVRTAWQKGAVNETVQTSEGSKVEAIGSEHPEEPILELDDEEDDGDE